MSEFLAVHIELKVFGVKVQDRGVEVFASNTHILVVRLGKCLATLCGQYTHELLKRLERGTCTKINK